MRIDTPAVLPISKSGFARHHFWVACCCILSPAFFFHLEDCSLTVLPVGPIVFKIRGVV